MKRSFMNAVAWTLRGRGRRRLLVAVILLVVFAMARPSLGPATTGAVGGLIVLAAVFVVLAFIIPTRKRYK